MQEDYDNDLIELVLNFDKFVADNKQLMANCLDKFGNGMAHSVLSILIPKLMQHSIPDQQAFLYSNAAEIAFKDRDGKITRYEFQHTMQERMNGAEPECLIKVH